MPSVSFVSDTNPNEQPEPHGDASGVEGLLAEPLADEPLAEEPPVEDPPADEPPADEPPAEEPPADEPPAEEPPVEEPPVEEPLVGEPQGLRVARVAVASAGEWLLLLQRHTQMMQGAIPADDEEQMVADRHALQAYLRDAPYVREILQMLVLAARSAGSAPASQASTRSGASSAGGRSASRDSDSWRLSGGGGDQSSTGGQASYGTNSTSESSESSIAEAPPNWIAQFMVNPRSSDTGTSSSSNLHGLEETVSLLPHCRLLGYSHWATTLTVHNIPHSYTQTDLLEKWPADGTYDFLHLRRTVASERPTRVVTINFTSPQHAERFYVEWQGQTLKGRRSERVISILVSSVQGRDANLMLVMNSSRELPVVLLGSELQSPQQVVELVRLARQGVFVERV